MDTQWEVQITGDGPTALDKLFIFQRLPDKKIALVTDLATGKIETINPFESTDKFTAKILTGDMRGIVSAFVRYAKSQGFKDSEETFSKGKLEATEKHLEDMRALVFKKD